MPPTARIAHRLDVSIGDEDFDLLTLHTTRLSVSKSFLAQLAIHEKLVLLDEELATIRANKAAAKRSNRVGAMGALPGGMGSAGMQITSPLSPTVAPPQSAPEPKILEKLDRSFRSYFEYVEAADGPIQRSIRIDRVHDDMRTRATDAEANLAFVEFQEKLQQRARLVPTVIKKLPDGVPVSGDLPEDDD